MTTITVMEPKTYQGKVTGYKITLADGVQGYLDDKGSDKGLSVGSQVDYLIAVKKNKSGGDYNLLTLKTSGSQTFAPSGGQTPSFAPIQPPVPSKAPIVSAEDQILKLKSETSLRLAEVVLEALFSGKTDSGQAMAKHKEYKEYLFGIIDECAR
jgi:hypothetical protein